MIELPEALTIAQEMDVELKGKRVDAGNRGNSPHKWVFTNRSSEEFERILAGKRISWVAGEETWVSVSLEPGFVLLIGDMGGRILYHKGEEMLLKKYHLLLCFDDGSYLMVAIQGWGCIHLVEGSQGASHRSKRGVSPLSDEFTFEGFNQMEKSLKDAVSTSWWDGEIRSIVCLSFLKDMTRR